MKSTPIVGLLAALSLLSSGCAGNSIPTVDHTADWNFPYTASPERTAKIHDASIHFKSKMLYTDFISQIGEPDQIDSLNAAFWGHSVAEDSFLVQNRPYFSYRAIWYVTKSGNVGVDMYDRWLTAYILNDGKRVGKIITNDLKRD
jgi:hypothetical protein